MVKKFHLCAIPNFNFNYPSIIGYKLLYQWYKTIILIAMFIKSKGLMSKLLRSNNRMPEKPKISSITFLVLPKLLEDPKIITCVIKLPSKHFLYIRNLRTHCYQTNSVIFIQKPYKQKLRGKARYILLSQINASHNLAPEKGFWRIMYSYLS